MTQQCNEQFVLAWQLTYILPSNDNILLVSIYSILYYLVSSILFVHYYCLAIISYLPFHASFFFSLLFSSLQTFRCHSIVGIVVPSSRTIEMFNNIGLNIVGRWIVLWHWHVSCCWHGSKNNCWAWSST